MSYMLQSIIKRNQAGTQEETTEECFFWLAQLPFLYSPELPAQRWHPQHWAGYSCIN